MRILFVSRAYPPVVGGIENQNHALSVWLPRYAKVTTLANRRGKKFLPFFFPFAILRSVWLMRKHDVLLLGDGVLAPVAVAVKLFYPEKIAASVVHGLDLTYQHPIYRTLWVSFFLPQLDKLFAVSKETERLALERGLAQEKLRVIPNGIDPVMLRHSGDRADLEALVGPEIRGKVVLLTAGRLAKRKGVAWFIREVLPLLSENVLYLVAGEGPHREAIEKARSVSLRGDAVRLLGSITNEQRNLLLNTTDIFVQPNIPVSGDVEGFGIAVIEAAACGRPVVASSLEGLQDAITHGANGLLAKPLDAESFRSMLQPLIEDELARQDLGAKARAFTLEHYRWSHIAVRYINELTASESEPKELCPVRSPEN